MDDPCQSRRKNVQVRLCSSLQFFTRDISLFSVFSFSPFSPFSPLLSSSLSSHIFSFFLSPILLFSLFSRLSGYFVFLPSFPCVPCFLVSGFFFLFLVPLSVFCFVLASFRLLLRLSPSSSVSSFARRRWSRSSISPTFVDLVRLPISFSASASSFAFYFFLFYPPSSFPLSTFPPLPFPLPVPRVCV